MAEKPLKIALGELRHRTIGRHSSLMPLGIGFIGAYLVEHLGEKVELRFYEDPARFFDDADDWKPDVVGLTNFMWNADLNRRAFAYCRERNPGTICVAGGPDIPVEPSACRDFLRSRPEIDFYAYLEGEVVFTELIRDRMRDEDRARLRSRARRGIMTLDPREGNLLFEGPSPRIPDLGEVPSPYLTGLMDGWFDGSYAPAVQTARGCPHDCAYCRASHALYSRVVPFPLERVKEELAHIAGRMADHPHLPLYILDSNFGMLDRDEEIAEHIGRLQDEHGWPLSIIADTSRQYDRVLRMSEHMKKRMNISCSFQSLNPRTLQDIHRRNMSLDEYRRVQAEIRRRRMKSDVELIVPLPEETLETFRQGVGEFFSAGADSITPFTLMVLPGTCFADPDWRARRGMKTRFRLIPRQFGSYRDEMCFEIEEVCVETATMPFADYLESRGFAFLCVVLADRQYDLLARHMAELRIDRSVFLENLRRRLLETDHPCHVLYHDFLAETEAELAESRDALRRRLCEPDTYRDLLEGKIGDNLVRKYRTRILCRSFGPFVETCFGALEECAGDALSASDRAALRDSLRWMTAVRDFAPSFMGAETEDEIVLDLSHDVAGWYEAENGQPLTSFRRPVRCRLCRDGKKSRSIVEQARTLYGADREFGLARILLEHRAETFWRRSEEIAPAVRNGGRGGS